MKRLIAALALIGLVGGYLVAPAEAQGRFWVLVNGALRYTGRVQINGGPVLFPDGTSAVPAIVFASEPTLGFYRPVASMVTLAGNFTSSGTITTGSNLNLAATGLLSWSGATRVQSVADGNLVIKNTGHTIGVQLKVDALPTVSLCGGGIPAVTAGSTPLSGSVTVGTGGPLTCTITFGGTAYPSPPHCSGAVETTTAANTRYHGYSASVTALTIVPNAAWADGSVVNWNCISSK